MQTMIIFLQYKIKALYLLLSNLNANSLHDINLIHIKFMG
jgi:hypothetical protein